MGDSVGVSVGSGVCVGVALGLGVLVGAGVFVGAGGSVGAGELVGATVGGAVAAGPQAVKRMAKSAANTIREENLVRVFMVASDMSGWGAFHFGWKFSRFSQLKWNTPD
ncbi:MAG: hypothetical protein ACE5GO_04975 [Anaerolineales bacterium]